MVGRVLIADSDPLLLREYRDYLDACDYEVKTVQGAVACMDALRDYAPDVLVLSSSLYWGGCDGVVAMMHEQPELRPPFVMVLARRDDRKSVYRAAAEEADDYHHKPLTPIQLEERLRSLIERYPDSIGLATSQRGRP